MNTQYFKGSLRGGEIKVNAEIICCSKGQGNHLHYALGSVTKHVEVVEAVCDLYYLKVC